MCDSRFPAAPIDAAAARAGGSAIIGAGHAAAAALRIANKNAGMKPAFSI
jgi:hypothetical protein